MGCGAGRAALLCPAAARGAREGRGASFPQRDPRAGAALRASRRQTPRRGRRRRRGGRGAAAGPGGRAEEAAAPFPCAPSSAAAPPPAAAPSRLASPFPHRPRSGSWRISAAGTSSAPCPGRPCSACCGRGGRRSPRPARAAAAAAGWPWAPPHADAALRRRPVAPARPGCGGGRGAKPSPGSAPRRCPAELRARRCGGCCALLLPFPQRWGRREPLRARGCSSFSARHRRGPAPLHPRARRCSSRRPRVPGDPGLRGR